jgi:hypothetical protein
MLDVRVLVDPLATHAALADLAGWAETLDLTYAWASSSGGSAAHWGVLPLDRVRRAIIGIHFAQTEPYVLRELHDRNVLRVVADTGGVFHPKLIVGVAGGEARAIVGSSNFTAGGFAGNTKLNVLLSGPTGHDAFQKLLGFVAQQWAHPRSFAPSDAWFDGYERLYKNRPSPPKMFSKKKPPKVVQTAGNLDIDWSDFVTLIGTQEQRSLWTGWTIHVFDHPDGSYLQEVEACHEAFAREPSFAAMAEEDRKLVAGWGDRTAGYYGRMQGAGYFKNITRAHPEQIAKHLDRVPLEGAASIAHARSYLDGIMEVRGVALGTATRLLCMKRPDLFLPANNASLINIARVFGAVPNTVEKYLALVEEIWGFPWSSAPKPEEASELRIWNARVALLDAIFYEPPEYLKA